MRNLMYAGLFILFISCNQSKEPIGTITDSSVFITNDTIPAIRAKIKKEPVATYVEAVSDDVSNANNWEFSARIYETPKTFVYRIEMRYQELRETAEMELPNFGTFPKPVIIKTGKQYACMIGFLDKKGEFKEYKKLSATNNRLKLTTVAHYAVGVYRTKIK
jgi:hypothetical protein